MMNVNNPNSVFGATDLNSIIDKIKQSKHEFWYVDRRARILKFEIKLIDDNDATFIRRKKIHTVCYSEFKNCVIKTEDYKAGRFYDDYYRYGHFFCNKNDAVKYMYKRVQTGRKEIVKKAQLYIDTHPECLV